MKSYMKTTILVCPRLKFILHVFLWKQIIWSVGNRAELVAAVYTLGSSTTHIPHHATQTWYVGKTLCLKSENEQESIFSHFTRRKGENKSQNNSKSQKFPKIFFEFSLRFRPFQEQKNFQNFLQNFSKFSCRRTLFLTCALQQICFPHYARKNKGNIFTSLFTQ